MKSDRELLALAAKAAGYTIHENGHDINGIPWLWCDEIEDNWYPLYGDGNALRLAVMLDMSIEVNRVDEMVTVTSGYNGEHRVVEVFGDCMFAATRRAIVRAAAAIGEAIQ
ncbi:hypothetical protein D3C79_286580 [compost metagenome]